MDISLGIEHVNLCFELLLSSIFISAMAGLVFEVMLVGALIIIEGGVGVAWPKALCD
jgi:hypothetical protein